MICVTLVLDLAVAGISSWVFIGESIPIIGVGRGIYVLSIYVDRTSSPIWSFADTTSHLRTISLTRTSFGRIHTGGLLAKYVSPELRVADFNGDGEEADYETKLVVFATVFGAPSLPVLIAMAAVLVLVVLLFARRRWNVARSRRRLRFHDL